METACAVGNADPRAKNKGCALWEHGTGELEKSHRVLQRISDALPYLARQLPGFIRLPTKGYTQGGRFWVRMRRDQELERADNTRFRQVQAANMRNALRPV
jgi:hypothetical protein